MKETLNGLIEELKSDIKKKAVLYGTIDLQQIADLDKLILKAKQETWDKATQEVERYFERILLTPELPVVGKNIISTLQEAKEKDVDKPLT